MTLKHRIKLIPARIRWFFTLIGDAHDTLRLMRSGALTTLRKAYWEEFIEIDRQDKSSIETTALKAKVELLDELIKMTHG